jgi:hypothetical protein
MKKGLKLEGEEPGAFSDHNVGTSDLMKKGLKHPLGGAVGMACVRVGTSDLMKWKRHVGSDQLSAARC